MRISKGTAGIREGASGGKGAPLRSPHYPIEPVGDETRLPKGNEDDVLLDALITPRNCPLDGGGTIRPERSTELGGTAGYTDQNFRIARNPLRMGCTFRPAKQVREAQESLASPVEDAGM